MMTSVVVVTIAVMSVIVVLGTVARLIFSRLHEINRSLARMVFVAVLAPILGVTRRYVQIDGLDWRGANHHRRGLRDHRLRVHHWRRRGIADRDLTVDSRHYRPTDGGVEADILGLCQRHDRREQRRND